MKYRTLEEDQIWGRGDKFRFGQADFEVLLAYPEGNSKTVVMQWVWSSEERSRPKMQIYGFPAQDGHAVRGGTDDHRIRGGNGRKLS